MMGKILTGWTFCCLLAVTARGQTAVIFDALQGHTAESLRPIISGDHTTAKCTPGVTANLFDPGTSLEYFCAATDTWSVLNNGSASGTVTSVGLVGTANQLTVTGASPITASGSWTISLPSVLTLPGTVNKITLTAPTTAATIQFAADNETVIFPAGTMIANTRAVNTSAPLGGGGALSADLTLTCATCGLTSNPLSQFAATTSAQLAGVISDETGSSLAVFNTSPLLVTPHVTTILDGNGNPFVLSTATASAVDGVTVTNAATANPATVKIGGSGSDANINIEIDAKGSGKVQLGASNITVDPSTGNFSTPGGFSGGVGGSVGGYSAFGQGTATTAPANSVGFMAPATVTTPFMMKLPAAPVTGLMLSTGTTDPTTISFVAPAANKVIGGATPSAVTITSAYVDNSIALTGTDINTSNQVTATHLAAALPVAQGGTGITAFGTGVATALGQNVSGTGAICLASGSACSGAGAVSSVQTLTGAVTLFNSNPQTATYQTVASDFTQCKTIPVASGTFTVTLVASGSQPADGECIRILNYGSGVVTVARSGQNINGAAADLTLAAGSASAPTGILVVSDGTNYFAQPYSPGGAVSSVFTRTGAVTATSGDYTCAQVTNCVDKTASNAYTTGDQDMHSATSLEVPAGAGTCPSASGGVAYDTTQVATKVFNGGPNTCVPVVLAPSVQHSATDTLTCSTIGTTETAFATKYTVKNGTLIGNKALRVSVGIQVVTSASPPTFQYALRWGGIGGTLIFQSNATGPSPSITNISNGGTFMIVGTGAAGASVNSFTSSLDTSAGAQIGTLSRNGIAQPVAIATNADKDLVFTFTCGANTAGNSASIILRTDEILN